MITTLIFDLGAVLIDWHPKHLYKKIFKTEAEIDDFLTHICTSHWNEEQDAGRSIKDGTEALIQQFPEHGENIRAFYGRWDEMLAGPIDGTLQIFTRLKQGGKYKIYALTNWSAETWPIVQQIRFFELVRRHRRLRPRRHPQTRPGVFSIAVG